MKKKNNFISKSLSFEDFEQAMIQKPSADTPIDELVHERLSSEKEARKKENELKRSYRKAKRRPGAKNDKNNNAPSKS